jgi:hypothetical protein
MSDDAIKTRIISHMNSSHSSSLSDYLQHYNNVPLRAASSAVLIDISLSSLSIRDGSNTIHTVPFSPPLASFADARPRTVAMDTTARHALGPRIVTYDPPRGPLAIGIVVGCTLFYSLMVTRVFIVPGTFAYDVLLRWFPGGPDTVLWIVKKLWPTMLTCHVVETVLLDRWRLQKYRVVRGSGLWWAWMGSCFMEGFGAYQRIDAQVKRQEAKIQEEKDAPNDHK